MRHWEARFLSCMYVLSLTLLVLFAVRGLTETVTVSGETDQTGLVILDAGHGGPDGGSSSQDGVLESDVNLEITLRTDAVLALMGQRTILTRDSSADLSSAGAETIAQKKVSDIRNRVSLVNDHPDGVLVSIHQNTYPDSSVHGAQVFFGRVGNSEELAKAIQASIYNTVDPGSNRETKPISRDVYLMNHAEIPAVLIECGFLTNEEEKTRLTSPDYQKRLAVAIAAAVSEQLAAGAGV